LKIADLCRETKAPQLRIEYENVQLFLSRDLPWPGIVTAVGNDLLRNPHLEPLRPLLGKTWKGAFSNSKPDNPTVDVARWLSKHRQFQIQCGKFIRYEGFPDDADDNSRAAQSVNCLLTAHFVRLITEGTVRAFSARDDLYKEHHLSEVLSKRRST
jgi:hypothetical protein